MEPEGETAVPLSHKDTFARVHALGAAVDAIYLFLSPRVGV